MQTLTFGTIFAGRSIWTVADVGAKSLPTFASVATRRRGAKFLLLLTAGDGSIVGHVAAQVDELMVDEQVFDASVIVAMSDLEL